MKVGIITLYGLSNYGNRLQNFAMEKALNELGCEAETVVMLPKIIKNGINFCKGNSVKSKRKRLFYNFTKENLHTKFYSNIKQFKDKYDFFIVGSDQIWHPCFTIYNKIRMLKFANSERCLSYAASFGVTKIPSYQKKYYKKGLLHIKNISVREDAGVEIVKKLTGKDCTVVVDPTMLLDQNQWSGRLLVNHKKIEGSYLLTYFLGKDKLYKSKIENFAKNNNLKIINLNSTKDRYYISSPDDFVWLIKNASLVCTDSFHGTVFSILMETPFVVFNRSSGQTNTSSRLDTLLKLTKLEKRKFGILNEADWLSINFEDARESVQKEREKSINFLKNALKINKNEKFIKILNKKDCCGCSACANICPQKCIKMEQDEEGFLVPKIDQSKCINCGLCKNVCPIINKKHPNLKFPQAYACVNKQLEIRKQSSSGGMFSLLAEFVLNSGGVVFGASFDKNWQVRHVYVDKVEDLALLRGSKYVQSDIGDCFTQAKKFLQEGRLVYFSGTPCQIAGLKSFLVRDYDNLITQDLICHGVPSPKVWESYLEYREKVAGGMPTLISFRDKTKSWQNYRVKFEFNNGNNYLKSFKKDPMMKKFLRNECLRMSCYSCAFKSYVRDSDFTLADFWGINLVAKRLNDNQGTSLILLNTPKAVQIFEKIKDNFYFKKVNFKKAIKFNPAIIKSVKIAKNREKIMKNIKNIKFK